MAVPVCPAGHGPLTRGKKTWLCEECDHRAPLTEESRTQAVFLSYAWRDALLFTQRLAVDLEAQRHQVWFDRECIEKGGLFEVRIEQGIRRASVVAAVMTAGSVREESVCRDEVVFALNAGKTIVPLKVTPEVQPTLLLARRNWIDFTAGYEQGRDALLRYLGGDGAALLPPRLPTITGVAPLDFGPEIAAFTAGFTGRDWLAAEIEGWLRRPGPQVFVLVGEPGIGKSAVAAWLCLSRPEVAAVHFCTARNTRTLDPHQFVASLVGQLAARLPGYAERVEARMPEVRRVCAADAFRELIVEPARQLTPPGGPRVMVVDSLDEAAAQAGETVVDVLVKQAPDLPDWLRVVTTTRPETPILERVRVLKVFELQANRDENRQDVQAYLEAHAPAGTAARLAVLAAGNFLYVRLALDAFRDGALTEADLGRLAPGLAEFYSLSFRRRFPDLEQFTQRQMPLLRALAAAREPLSFALLCRVAGAEPEVVNQRLLELRTFLRTAGSEEESTWALYHQSLADWLTSRDAAGVFWCPAVKGHARLAEVLADQWPTERYALRHLATHQVAAGQGERAAELLGDWRYLEAKAEAGLVFDLAGDFTRLLGVLPRDHPRRRMLGLVEEAIRQEIHFLQRHPTTLFQCVWNSGWWYDCPQAAAHYVEGRSPGQEAGVGLHRWLEEWRAGKEQRQAGFVWLRSLRPPAVHLGTAQKAVFRGHDRWVSSVAYAPDGQRIVSGSADNTVRVWDAVSGQQLLCLRGHEGGVTSVAYAPHGQRIVSGSYDNTVRVWDAASGQELLCLSGHERGVCEVAYAPDGQRIVSGSFDNTVRVWDAVSGQQLLCLRGHEGGVYSVGYAPDGQRIVSGSGDETVRVWDAASGQQLLCLRGQKLLYLGMGMGDHGVSSVAYAPDGQRIVSGSADNTVWVWDAASGQELLCLSGHESTVDSVAYAPDGQRIVSGSSDETIRVWDAVSGQELLCLRGHEKWVNSVAYAPDGQRIVSGSHDNTVRVWDAVSGQEPLRLRGHQNWLSSVAYAPDGRRVVSGSLDHTVRAWDAASGQELLCLSGHESTVDSVAYAPDGRRIVSGSADSTVRVWDAASGQELLGLRGHENDVTSVAYAPDGQCIVSVSYITVRVWDAASGQELLCLRGHGGAVAYAPDGQRIVGGSYDETVRVWDAASGQELLCLRGHESDVTSVAYAPDGQRIVSGSYNTVRVWDAVSGECLEVLQGKTDVSALAAGRQCYPWRGRTKAGETVIENAATGEPLAWFPLAYRTLTTHPSGLSWAGWVSAYLSLFALEGAPQRVRNPGSGP